MDLYDGPYFRLNKSLMTKGGLWPHDTNRAKRFAGKLFLGTGVIVMMLPQLYGFYKNLGVHLDKVFEHTAILLYFFCIFGKFMTPILAENRMKKVYADVAENWTVLKDRRERKILGEYSENGILLTKGYMAYMLMATAFYIMLPLTPLLLNVVAPLNESRQPIGIFKGEFPVDDARDYYVWIFAMDVFGCFVSVYILVTVDTMYSVCIEHYIGLFAIIRYRLESCTDITNIHDRNVAHERIVEIVKLHTKTIELIDLFEETFSIFFLFSIGCNMLHATLALVIILIKKDELIELIRYAGILGGIITHLFYLIVSWPSQKLIDNSTGLFDNAYNNEWYEFSRESKILLKFMRLRCLKPCKLTAGSLYVMNFVNFASIIKTSASYIAVFSSFTS